MKSKKQESTKDKLDKIYSVLAEIKNIIVNEYYERDTGAITGGSICPICKNFVPLASNHYCSGRT